jgi:hypothetical protein
MSAMLAIGSSDIRSFRPPVNIKSSTMRVLLGHDSKARGARILCRIRPPGMVGVPSDCPEQSWPTARDGGSAKRLSGTIVADRQGWWECQAIVRNNRGSSVKYRRILPPRTLLVARSSNLGLELAISRRSLRVFAEHQVTPVVSAYRPAWPHNDGVVVFFDDRRTLARCINQLIAC